MIDWQYDLDTWEDFVAKVTAIEEAHAEARRMDKHGYVSHLLFRGQASYGWELATTLERANTDIKKLGDYYRFVAVAKTQIETFTGKSWPEIDVDATYKRLQNYDEIRFAQIPFYELLVYLRQHGFPSPLMDWTKSPYIAAYFACNTPVGDRIAIWAYQEHTGNGKLSTSKSPQIMCLGPNVRSDPRHFLQQAEYTLALQFINSEWCIAPHEDVFRQHILGQDKLLKFTLPRTEATKIMSWLDRVNINSYSLFQTEDTLLDTISRRELTKRRI